MGEGQTPSPAVLATFCRAAPSPASPIDSATLRLRSGAVSETLGVFARLFAGQAGTLGSLAVESPETAAGENNHANQHQRNGHEPRPAEAHVIGEPGTGPGIEGTPLRGRVRPVAVMRADKPVRLLVTVDHPVLARLGVNPAFDEPFEPTGLACASGPDLDFRWPRALHVMVDPKPGDMLHYLLPRERLQTPAALGDPLEHDVGGATCLLLGLV